MADSHLKNDEFLPDSTAFYTLSPLVFFEKSKGFPLVLLMD